MNSTSGRIRLGALCLLVAAVMFVLYPALRPWADESTVEGAVDAMSSGAWVASHAFAMVGFTLVGLGMLSLWGAVRSTRAERVGLATVVTGWVGAGLTLPYYGAEDFGLHEVAAKAAAGESVDVLGLAENVRYNPVAITFFGIGLVTLAASGVLAAVTVARSDRLPRWSGLVFAVGYVLFLPQFFAPAPVRIAHGVVLGVGLAWLGLALWRAKTNER